MPSTRSTTPQQPPQSPAPPPQTSVPQTPTRKSPHGLATKDLTSLSGVSLSSQTAVGVSTNTKSPTIKATYTKATFSNTKRQSLLSTLSPYKSPTNNGRTASLGTINNHSSKLTHQSIGNLIVPPAPKSPDTYSVHSNSVTSTIIGDERAIERNGKHGTLLGPFIFMTQLLEENKLKEFNQRDLETISKQFEMLKYQLRKKFDQDRNLHEAEIMKAWMLVCEKEEEAYMGNIREQTMEDIHRVHYRLLEMVSHCYSYRYTSIILICWNRKKQLKKYVKILFPLLKNLILSMV